jgi:Family of unknown function (DUF5681)
MAEQDDSVSTENSVENSTRGAPHLDPWRFKPGQSGNPGGRPKKKPITELYEGILDDPKAMARARMAIVKTLSRSDMAMVHLLKEIADRIEGKVSQSIEHSGRMTLEQLVCAREVESSIFHNEKWYVPFSELQALAEEKDERISSLEAQVRQLREALTKARNGACGCHSPDNTCHMSRCWKLKVIAALAATEPK